ncbi:unnamed protein product [Caenorhabditis auriculariae]|uniref:G-protein coupled receptors family 1 profile domain-containing protein n=1 Tax=Caenorhabditis auriculariae TaxID=2777116 RepID=A0A8S1H5Q8_9PELO|nr:unnamed protein product [Caenorhabditis auriculariae]
MLFSACLHIPMMLQSTWKLEGGVYTIVNNVSMLCREPQWTIYSYYKLTRECFRFFCVVMMTALNVIIARKLQITKMRRRRLVRRSSPLCENEKTKNNTNCNSSSPEPLTNNTAVSSTRKEYTSLIKSFTEKKLTVLMIAICFIFILGNVPQMIVMVLQNEAMEHVFGFQVYRYCSNLLEVMNHCLNFYVFCMASSEYTRAFLLNCMCLRNILLRFPAIADFISARRSSSFLATSSGIGMQNREYMSMESLQDDATRWELRNGDVKPYLNGGEATNLKGILITGNRENRQKKNLTIVNHLTLTVENAEETENLYKMSMFGKDKALFDQENQSFQRYNQWGSDYNTSPPKYNGAAVTNGATQNVTKARQMELRTVEKEPIECTPNMLAHPMALLRWFELALFFLLQWLVQITCGGDACTMIMNVFGYTAMGQLFVLLIFLLLSIICTLILIGYGLNAHKALGGAILAVERIYAILGILLMFVAGILGTWMAVLTRDPEVNYQGRGHGHIRGQWIAAAVIEFLMALLYVFDLMLQRRENYPFTGKGYTTADYNEYVQVIVPNILPAMPTGTAARYYRKD